MAAFATLRSISDISLVYRLNTYPVIHTGFFHTFINLLAVTPLLERFEAEHGTLTAIALFIGRESSRKSTN
jgi:membrane associated rhomboid family serine protease